VIDTMILARRIVLSTFVNAGETDLPASPA